MGLPVAGVLHHGGANTSRPHCRADRPTTRFSSCAFAERRSPRGSAIEDSRIADRHPRLRRYWHLVGEITGEPASAGVTYAWFLDALDQLVPTCA